METKYYTELNETEKAQFRNTIACGEETVLNFAEKVDGKTTDIKIAFDEEGDMVDFCIFDPYHEFECQPLYIYANGESNWWFDSVED